MTKEELLDKLRHIFEESQSPDRDLENGHIASDESLLEYIGDKEISVAFDKIEKWYA